MQQLNQQMLIKLELTSGFTEQSYAGENSLFVWTETRAS